MTPEVEPQEVGLDPARLERLDRHLDDGRQIGSMIVITRGGRIAHVSQRGRRDARRGCRSRATRSGGSSR
jgi:hypothetical protein